MHRERDTHTHSQPADRKRQRDSRYSDRQQTQRDSQQTQRQRDRQQTQRDRQQIQRHRGREQTQRDRRRQPAERQTADTKRQTQTASRQTERERERERERAPWTPSQQCALRWSSLVRRASDQRNGSAWINSGLRAATRRTLGQLGSDTDLRCPTSRKGRGWSGHLGSI